MIEVTHSLRVSPTKQRHSAERRLDLLDIDWLLDVANVHESFFYYDNDLRSFATERHCNKAV